MPTCALAVARDSYWMVAGFWEEAFYEQACQEYKAEATRLL